MKVALWNAACNNRKSRDNPSDTSIPPPISNWPGALGQARFPPVPENSGLSWLGWRNRIGDLA